MVEAFASLLSTVVLSFGGASFLYRVFFGAGHGSR